MTTRGAVRTTQTPSAPSPLGGYPAQGAPCDTTREQPFANGVLLLPSAAQVTLRPSVSFVRLLLCFQKQGAAPATTRADAEVRTQRRADNQDTLHGGEVLHGVTSGVSSETLFKQWL